MRSQGIRQFPPSATISRRAQRYLAQGPASTALGLWLDTHLCFSGHVGRERDFVPEEGVSIEEYLARGDRTAVHHLLRYEWACDVLATEDSRVKTVLDIACGAGYGSHQIAQRFLTCASSAPTTTRSR